MNVTATSVRRALGLHGIDLARPETIDRRGFERFVRHLELLGQRPASIIDICEPDASDRGTHRLLPGADYLRINAANALPVFCLRNGVAPVPGATDGGFASLCADYGMAAPYWVLLEPPLRHELLTARLAGLLPRTTVFGVSVSKLHWPRELGRIAAIDSWLRNAGFVLHDCLEHDTTVRRKRDCRQLLVYVPAAGPLHAARAGPAAGARRMRNCLILGMGRSGTSLLGGILYRAGYYLGENLYRPRSTNPRGFFECAMINCLNEDILARYRNVRSGYIDGSPAREWLRRLGAGWLFNPDHRRLQGWLCDIPEDVPVESDDPAIARRIGELTKRVPFCYKDPRFSYTLPIWRRHMDGDAVYVCMFREPGRATASILKESAEMPYLRGLRIDRRIALGIYENAYRHILRYNSEAAAQLLFVHYDQLLSGSAVPLLSERLGVQLTPDFADATLSRSRDDEPVTPGAARIYDELCERAGFS